VSSEVEIRLTAIDEASSVINQVASNVDRANTEITGSSQEVTAATRSVDTSVKDNVLSFNNMATAGMGLYLAIDRVQNSQVMLDRANLNVERSTEAVHKAQEAYNIAVEKFGADSPQAHDALTKLQIAQDALRVSEERQEMAQRNANNSMMMAALTVIPSLVTMVSSISTAVPLASKAFDALSNGLDFLAANPIVLAIAGIAALITWLVLAYQNCAPFRNAINEIGSVIGGAVLAAVNALRDAFSWLWNNVLVPLGTYIVGTYVAQWNALRDALDWLWENILKPIADFLEKTFITALNDVSKAVKPLEDVVNAVGGAAKAVGGAMSDVAGAVGGGLSKAGGAISGFIGGLCFAHALAQAAEESTKTMDSWAGMIKDSMDKGLGAIKDFNREVGITGPAGITAEALKPGIGVGGKPPEININSPLMYVAGSMDQRAAQVATQTVIQLLQSVVINPTSQAAPAVSKQVQISTSGIVASSVTAGRSLWGPTRGLGVGGKELPQ
jgi:hypothetical protein